MSFLVEVNASLGWKWVEGASDNSKLITSPNPLSFAEGAADNQAEAVWHAENQVILDTGSTVLDLTALSRTVLGDTLTIALTRIKALMLLVDADSDGEIDMGNATYDAWWAPFGAADHTIRAAKGSPLLMTNMQAGWPVSVEGAPSSSSGESGGDRLLRLLATGGDVTYDIAIIGETSERASSSSG